MADTAMIEISPFEEWENCPNTLWVGREAVLGYVSPVERHQESSLHEDGMFVLDYTSAGEQDVLVDSQWRIVPAQHVLWTSPNAQHAHRVPQSIESIYFLMLPQVVEEVWQHQERGEPPPHLAVVSGHGALENTMHRALREARERRPGYDYLLSLLLRQAIAECFRTLAHTGMDLPTIGTYRSPILTPLRHASEILRTEHDRPDLTLQEVAQRVGFSYFHFSRLFKDELGTTPGRYLRQLRLMHAVPLLLRTELTLEAIAYVSGFGSARRLAEACKDELGHGPREIRAAGSIRFVAGNSPAQESAKT